MMKGLYAVSTPGGPVCPDCARGRWGDELEALTKAQGTFVLNSDSWRHEQDGKCVDCRHKIGRGKFDPTKIKVARQVTRPPTTATKAETRAADAADSPPAQWWADLQAAIVQRFPGARLDRRKMQELRPYFVAEWRNRQKPQQSARTVCSCDGKTLKLNQPIDVPKLRPPQGAKRGDVFGADELRRPAAVVRVEQQLAKTEKQLRQVQRARGSSSPDQPDEAALRVQLDELKQRRDDRVKRAVYKPPTPTRRPPARRPSACPAGVPACSLGLLGGWGGLPAPLVLASAQGSPSIRTARYCLTSVWGLLPSHDARKGFAPNPTYPKGVQERAYDRDPGEKMKVINIAQNLIPELIFNGSPGAIDGLPVTTSTGIVLGGNGRTQALQLHYAEGGTAARKYLLANSRQFGFTPKQVAAIRDPAVVRVIETPAPDAPDHARTLRELVRLLNVPLLQGLRQREESVAEAHRLSDEALEVLSVGLGDDLSLAEYLSSSQSRTFRDALRRSGILTDRNAGRLLNAGGESFSDDGKVFIERLLTAALVPDAVLLDEAGGQVRGTLARGAPWLLSAAAAGAEWDLRPAMRAALQDLIDLRRRDIRSVDAYLRQQVIGEPPAVQNVPNGEEVLRLLFSMAGRPVVFGRFAKQFAELSRLHPSAQFSLLPQEKVEPAEALRRAAALASK